MDPKRTQRPAAVSSPADRPGRKPGFGSTPVLGPAARRAVPAPVPAGELLDRLARDVKQLQVDFERFFSGALPFLPEELRGSIQAQLRHLRGANLTAAADNFRLGDLEARFNTYNELFNRRLREREEGRRAARPAPPAAERRFDPRQGIVVAGAVEPEAAAALYQGLATGGEAPRFDLGTFQSYLDRQVAAIRGKTGCAEVQFRLAEEDGKLKLKARPIGAPAGS